MNRNNAKDMQSETLSKVMSDIELDNISPDGSQLLLSAAQPAGAVLRDARVAKNLSLQDVSKHLRISVKQIEALEDDNFATLPEPVIVRGFIRNYARMLGVSAEPILDAYKLHSPEVAQSFTVQSSINMPIISKDKQSWVKYVVASVIIILGVGVWLFYADLMGTSAKLGLVTSSLAPETTTVTTTAPEPLPEIALPAAERAATETEQPAQIEPATQTELSPAVTNTEPKSAAANVIPATNTLSVAPVTVLPTPQASPVVTTTVKAEGLASATTTKLNFSAKEETWLNVSDANGKVIYSKVLAAGTQDSLLVQAALPIKVIVGNINGTTLIFNGNPVDLASYAKLNVAKFSLK